MPEKKPISLHDMRTKHAREKLYGTTANRDVIHGFPPRKPKKDVIQDSPKKEGDQHA